MKSQFVSIVLTAGLTVLGSLALSAQDQVANAKIPFAFHANQKSLVAGDYSIYRMSTSGLFELTSKVDGKSIFVNAPLPVGGKQIEDGHLTFSCYGEDCVLSQIWLPGSDTGYTRSDSAVNHDLPRKIGMAAMISVPLHSH